LPVVTLDVGLGLGGAWLHQGFATSGVAPSRDSPAGFLDVGLGLTVPIAWGASLRAESAVMSYVFSQEQAGRSSLGPWFSFRQLAGLSKEW
jgi:hypothetical protein